VCLIRVGDELCRTVDRQEQDWLVQYMGWSNKMIQIFFFFKACKLESC